MTKPNQKEVKLKLCPFCGSSAHLLVVGRGWVHYEGCRCSMNSVKEWNTRKPSVELDEEIAAAICERFAKPEVKLPEKKMTHTKTHIQEDADFNLGFNAAIDKNE